MRHTTRRVRFPRASQMVRGRCPRDCIRWAVDIGRRTVGDVGAIGHAERMCLTYLGNPANAGRRGRRPLRWARDEGCGIQRGGCDSLTPTNGARAVPAGLHTWAVNGGGRAAGDVEKIGQAQRLRLTYPGCHATTVHRGRCTLRVAAKPSLRHETQQLRKAIPKRPAHLTAPLKPASRNHRRGRRPRRPFRWMTDNVGFTLILSHTS